MSSSANLLLRSGVVAALIAFLGNVWVTHQGNVASLMQEKRKHDADMILQAIDPTDIGRTREMLKFIIDANLIENSGDLKSLLEEPGNLPATRGAIACYAHQSEDGASGTEGPIRVVGIVEDIPGYYEGRLFRPQGFEGADLSESDHFRMMCHRNLPTACPDETICWAGGDTGGYYGFQ